MRIINSSMNYTAISRAIFLTKRTILINYENFFPDIESSLAIDRPTTPPPITVTSKSITLKTLHINRKIQRIK